MELQSFLGLVNHYSRYVPSMATICSSLNELLKKDREWQWTEDCDQAYEKLKESLTSRDDLLIHYDPDKPLLLAVDASPVGLGAVISHETADGEFPIAYASRSLKPAEKNYSQIEREGLGIIFGLQKFHSYLYGRKFTLITDNKPLSLIFGPRKGIPMLAAARIQRWAIQLASYDYDICFRASNKNGNADALSRLPLPCVEGPEELVNWTDDATAMNKTQENRLPVTAKAISKATRYDPTLSKVAYFTVNGWPTADDLHTEMHAYYRRRWELSMEKGCLL